MTKFSTILFSVFILGGIAAFSFSNAGEFEIKANKVTSLQVVKPVFPMVEGERIVENVQKRHSFQEWDRLDHAQSYLLMQQLIRDWKQNTIDNYVVWGQMHLFTQHNFCWHAVPFASNEYSWLKQLRLIWHVLIEDEEKASPQPIEILDQQNNFAGLEKLEESKILLGHDVFCDPAIIESHTIIDQPDKTVRVLYNHRPLSKYHFLIVPKNHHEKFSDLPIDSYLEACEYAQLLINTYGQAGRAIYLYHKSGHLAGQTVFHWHLHVLIFEQETSWNNLLKILFKIGLSTPLDAEELAKRVSVFKDELK